MPMSILVVNPETAHTSRLTALLLPYAATLSLQSVKNRKEALAALEKASFQQIITSLRIPGVSDGYRFLAQIANKALESKKIVALVDHKTDGVRAGIAAFGLEHIYVADDFEGIVKVILQNAELVSSPVKQVDSFSETTAVAAVEIRSALSRVMGPVGSLIYENALKLWVNKNDTSELVNIIATEIGEDEQINQFFNQLR